MNMPSNFKAYLFDYDGVLANTMDYNYKSWREAFREIDLELDQNSYFLDEGLSRKKVAEKYLSLANQNTELAQTIAKRKEEIFFDKYSNQVQLYLPMIELIKKLKHQGKKLAVVTGSSKERLQQTKINENFLPLFDSIITADDLEHSKPHPDPYLKAVENLNLTPQDCLVIENAPLGIQAANEAKIICAAIATTLNPEQLSKANFVFNNINDFVSNFNEEGIL